VQDKGRVDFRGRRLTPPRAFRGYHVALRPLDEDGLWAIYFGTAQIASIELATSERV
jgi:hypothetical protein